MTWTCGRCGAQVHSEADAEGWNVSFDQGVFVEFTCAGCVTPLEYAEAEINEATLDYGYRTADGRHCGRSKADPDTEVVL